MTPDDPPQSTGATDQARAPRARRPVLLLCGECRADISRVALGFLLPTALKPILIIVQPLRCPECNAPAFYATPDTGLIITRGLS